MGQPSDDKSKYEVKLILTNRRITDVNLPAGTSVHINDYDTDKYVKDSLEKDSKGVLCRMIIWTRYPYDNQNRQIHKIDHQIWIAVRKGKVFVQKCPKRIKLVLEEIK